MRARSVPIAALAAPVVAVLLLAGCSSNDGSAATAGSSSAPASTVAAAPASPVSGASGSGAITFTGTYSGKMTVDLCDKGQVILDVQIDGHTPSSGGIDPHGDFGFNGPKGEVFIPASKAGNAKRSGKTYTVTDVKLSSGKAVVTANGSVTCP